ncbi:exported hypothetical protein [Nitrospina gracilis 3/211]|uniref:Uncharacterized protein n=1 Tax=Nitrospina gracilis (strain 3/211) TaxID=1266370 RepID=M1ZCC5_NITG3|nr:MULTISPECIES: hypothetical protein [Nitrospina]MCF8723861.1 hypothetical protein [Nitrospina sp. Nb-3]CCQ90980.1 exported hypothetical protein [Nitrospina gracilis 3/211]
MKMRWTWCWVTCGLILSALAGPAWAGDDFKTSSKFYKGGAPKNCPIDKTTICTMEIWLEFKHKKNKKQLWQVLKDKHIKVLGHTIQFWRPRGGHPPTNIAIGGGLSAEDARWAIEFALKYNDNIDGLIFQRLNPPHYVAVATSAWDAKSETKITPEQLEQLRDPKLTTPEFHALYVKLTGEKEKGMPFY